MICPNCGREVSDSAAFCESCGRPLAEAEAAKTVLLDGGSDKTVLLDDGGAAETTYLPSERTRVLEERRQLDQTLYAPGSGQVMAPVTGRTPGELESRLRERKRRGALGAFFAFLVLAALAAGGWWAYTQEYGGGVSVPRILGLSEDEARSALMTAGFEASFDERLSDSGIGTVIATDPAGGTRIDKGSTVTATIAVARTVPAIDGLSFEEARAKLEEAGARSIAVTYASSNREEGTVIGVSPAEGEVFVAAQEITVTIAQAYTVPMLIGKTLDEAISALESSGLGYRVLHVSSPKASNTIVSTSPSAGAKLKEGDVVELSVASPRPKDAKQLVSYFSMTPQQIATFLTDEKAELEKGYVLEEGIYARYKLTSGDKVIFTSVSAPDDNNPYAMPADPLADGEEFILARYEHTAENAKTYQPNESGAKALAEACGFTGEIKGIVTDQTINAGIATAAETGDGQVPEEGEGTFEPRWPGDRQTPEAPASDEKYISVDPALKFAYAYGEQDGCVWVVGIVDDGRATAMVLPAGRADTTAVREYGGVARYYAYVDLG